MCTLVHFEIPEMPPDALLQTLPLPLLRAARPLLEALAYPYGADALAEAIHPLWRSDEVRARITAVAQQTEDSLTLRLRPNRAWRGFAPGQFVTVTAPVDGVLVSRCFSPCSSAHRRRELELTMRVMSGGRLTPWLKRHALPGMVLRLSQAAGSFHLPASRPRRLLLISGGSGITPMLSMARTLADEGYAGELVFLHFARSAAHQLHADAIASLPARLPGARLLRVYERGAGGEAEGRFTPALLETLVPGWREMETFLCGPGPMMDAVRAHWQAAGLDERLHMERFAPAAARPADPADPAGGTLHLAVSGMRVPADFRSILEQAEAAGLRPAHGCRMGICHSCLCRKTAGQVRDLITGRLSSEGPEHIRICISAPVGDVHVEL